MAIVRQQATGGLQAGGALVGDVQLAAEAGEYAGTGAQGRTWRTVWVGSWRIRLAQAGEIAAMMVCARSRRPNCPNR